MVRAERQLAWKSSSAPRHEASGWRARAAKQQVAALKSGRESIPCPRFENWKEDDEIQAHMEVTVKVNLAQERVEKI